jgi:hypothetical protein
VSRTAGHTARLRAQIDPLVSISAPGAKRVGEPNAGSLARRGEPEGGDGSAQSFEAERRHELSVDVCLDGRVRPLGEQDLSGTRRVAEPSGEDHDAFALASGRCIAHDPAMREEKHAASVKGGENRRRPRASEIFRERVEAELEDWLRPYCKARDSDDQALALKAADSILDRAYGRARQATELSSPDGGLLSIEELAAKMLGENATTALEHGWNADAPRVDG